YCECTARFLRPDTFGVSSESRRPTFIRFGLEPELENSSNLNPNTLWNIWSVWSNRARRSISYSPLQPRRSRRIQLSTGTCRQHIPTWGFGHLAADETYRQVWFRLPSLTAEQLFGPQ